jgi:hypothetical protein
MNKKDLSNKIEKIYYNIEIDFRKNFEKLRFSTPN